MIPAHGGQLVNRMVGGAEREALIQKAEGLKKITLSAREMADVEMIGVGAMSPLEGFMTQSDYDSVVEKMRLADGTPWPLPIVLAVKQGDDAGQYDAGQDIALHTEAGQLVAVLHCESKWNMDKGLEARSCLLTEEDAHPGVQYLNSIGDTYLGGKLSVVNAVEHTQFNEGRLTPADMRRAFEEKGWKTVVAFQTRNPIHRAHEYLTKVALEMVDGLLIHPLMGETKSDDVPAAVRWDCYHALLENYYPADRTMLGVYPQAMRYAGPREALLHAIVRQNYGATHIIIGRDHAGVGSYYGTYDAQQIFGEYEAGELAITPLMFEHSFFCKKSGGMASDKTSNSGKEDRIFLSGTQVRAMLKEGTMPPPEFTRPEVAQILIDAMREKVEA